MENDVQLTFNEDTDRFIYLRTSDVATLVGELNQLQYLFRIIFFDVDKNTGAATAVLDKAPLFVVTSEDMVPVVDTNALEGAIKTTKSA